MTMRSTTPTGEWINRAAAAMSKARNDLDNAIHLAAHGLEHEGQYERAALIAAIEEMAKVQAALKLAEAPF